MRPCASAVRRALTCNLFHTAGDAYSIDYTGGSVILREISLHSGAELSRTNLPASGEFVIPLRDP